MDIKDLNLSKMNPLPYVPLSAYSKHLCGSATDLALRALTRYTNENSNW